ncbi:hypothetical protein [Alkalicoccobacillus porphyridii]|uniref:LPXTG cell wall anchor domain-containing protein n=1 Tax=Alkalicoccobacillus porphyridii TaxID=2597270 RepID=A0A554A272_9BACI|nr:hypothetical protein [Alkalicoccobacillus porphyridii]TSB47791.1 hypothetical protein FN960_04550 [Alkalicoccobacillus porphyridii]
MKRSSILTVLLALLGIHFSIAAAAATGHEYDEKEFRAYLVDMFQADDVGEFGFTTEDIEQMTFGEPVPIYDLNPAFAFGKSDELIEEEFDEWISVVFENGKPINGLKLREYSEGKLSVSGFGYPLTLTADVTDLEEDEILFYEFPTGYYYAFNQNEDSIRLLEEEVIANQPDDERVEGSSVEEFQTILEKRYEDYENISGDETLSSGLGGSEPAQPQSILLYSSIGIGVVLLSSLSLILWKRKRA